MGRVVFVSYEIHPTTSGGCGVLLHHAAVRLLRDGHEVAFLLDIPPELFRRFDEVDRAALARRAGVDASRCSAWSVEALSAGRAPSRPRGLSDPSWGSVRLNAALTALLERWPATIVEFFDFLGPAHGVLSARAFAERDGGPAIVVRLHNSVEMLDAFAGGRWMDPLRETIHALERLSIARADAVLTPSLAYFESHAKALYGSGRCGEVVVSPPPREPAYFRWKPPEPGEGVRPAVYLGRLYAFKGLDLLVRAASRVMRRRPELDLRVDLIGPDSDDAPGGGSYVYHLVSMIPAGLRPRFRFRGPMPRDAVAEALSRARFAVFPNRCESFCYALHEVYDAGVPCVTADLPVWREHFVDGETCIGAGMTEQSLEAALERAASDETLLRRVSKSREVMIEPLGRVYDEPPKVVLERGGRTETVVVVLSERGQGAARERTLAALKAQRRAPGAVVVLEAADPLGEHDAFLLGRAWVVVQGSLRSTLDALVVLSAGDEPEPAWLDRCSCALERVKSAGFSLTWTRSHTGEVEAAQLDTTPGRWVIERPTARTRALVRTPRGAAIEGVLGQGAAEALPPGLHAAAELGLLLHAAAKHGPGLELAEPLLTRAECDVGGHEAPGLVSSLQRQIVMSLERAGDGVSGSGTGLGVTGGVTGGVARGVARSIMLAWQREQACRRSEAEQLQARIDAMQRLLQQSSETVERLEELVRQQTREMRELGELLAEERGAARSAAEAGRQREAELRLACDVREREIAALRATLSEQAEGFDRALAALRVSRDDAREEVRRLRSEREAFVARARALLSR